MHPDQTIEEKRAAIIVYYQGESARMELQSRELLRLSGLCLTWAENARTLAAGGVEYVHGVVERAKAEQTERLSSQALANAVAGADREIVAEKGRGWMTL